MYAMCLNLSIRVPMFALNGTFLVQLENTKPEFIIVEKVHE